VSSTERKDEQNGTDGEAGSACPAACGDARPVVLALPVLGPSVLFHLEERGRVFRARPHARVLPKLLLVAAKTALTLYCRTIFVCRTVVGLFRTQAGRRLRDRRAREMYAGRQLYPARVCHRPAVERNEDSPALAEAGARASASFWALAARAPLLWAAGGGAPGTQSQQARPVRHAGAARCAALPQEREKRYSREYKK